MKGHEPSELVGTVNQFLCLALILLGHLSYPF